MHVTIPETNRRALLSLPLYTPVLLGLADREVTSLTIRVDDLQSFRQAEIPITIKFVAHRSTQGTWVMCVAFRVADNPHEPLEGDAYLNPRQREDYENLLALARQKIFSLIFLAADLSDAVGKQISWGEAQREEVFRAIMTMRKDLAGEKLSGGFDSDFEQAKIAFQNMHSVGDLLTLT